MNGEAASGALQSATRRALDAATFGDLCALEAALAEREAAIREITNVPQSEQAAALQDTAQDGEAIRELLIGLRRMIEGEAHNLERLSVDPAPRRQVSVDLLG